VLERDELRRGNLETYDNRGVRRLPRAIGPVLNVCRFVTRFKSLAILPSERCVPSNLLIVHRDAMSVTAQAYDDRIQSAQSNQKAWDQERERRNREREEWARQAKERSEARIKARAEFYQNIRKIKEQKEMHAKLAEQFYQELRDRNPEWEIRRQEVLKVKDYPPAGSGLIFTLTHTAQRNAREGTDTQATHYTLEFFLFDTSYLSPKAGVFIWANLL
jgi:hypothetical protein